MKIIKNNYEICEVCNNKSEYKIIYDKKEMPYLSDIKNYLSEKRDIILIDMTLLVCDTHYLELCKGVYKNNLEKEEIIEFKKECLLKKIEKINFEFFLKLFEIDFRAEEVNEKDIEYFFGSYKNLEAIYATMKPLSVTL